MTDEPRKTMSAGGFRELNSLTIPENDPEPLSSKRNDSRAGAAARFTRTNNISAQIAAGAGRSFGFVGASFVRGAQAFIPAIFAWGGGGKSLDRTILEPRASQAPDWLSP